MDKPTKRAVDDYYSGRRRTRNGARFLRMQIVDEATDVLLRKATVTWEATRIRADVRKWQCWLVRAEPSTLTVDCGGYGTLILKDIHLPPDTVCDVRISLPTGNDTVTAAFQQFAPVYESDITILPPNTIQGWVRDFVDRSPITTCTLFCEQTGLTAVTDSAGWFSLPCDTVMALTLHLRSPRGDAAPVFVNKKYIRSVKQMTALLEDPRRCTSSAGACPNPVQPLVVTVRNFGLGSSYPEASDNYHVLLVRDRDFAGPTTWWERTNRLPLRWTRSFKKRSDWVDFISRVPSLSLRLYSLYDSTILAEAIEAGREILYEEYDPERFKGGCLPEVYWADQLEKNLEALEQCHGFDVTFELVRDYCPEQAIAHSSTLRVDRELQLIHLQYLLDYLALDTASFRANYFSCPSGRKTGNKSCGVISPPTIESIEKTPIPNLVDLQSIEIYQYDHVGCPCNRRFVDIATQADLDYREGDVLVRFPPGSDSPMRHGWAAIYRQIDGRWLVIAQPE